jgi:hypothetical protein
MLRIFVSLCLGVLGGACYLFLIRTLFAATVRVVGTYNAPDYPIVIALASFGIGSLFWGLGEGLGKFNPIPPAFRYRVLGICVAFLVLSTHLWAFLGYANGRQGQVSKETTQIREVRRDLQDKNMAPSVKTQKEAELARLEQDLLRKPEDGRSSFLLWQWAQNAVLALFPLLGLFGGMALLRERIAPHKTR